jgi:hypothetical protein
VEKARLRASCWLRQPHVYSAVALDLLRLHAWWNGHALDRTRTTLRVLTTLEAAFYVPKMIRKLSYQFS